MKKIIAGLIIAGSLMMAAPAQAHPGNHTKYLKCHLRGELK